MQLQLAQPSMVPSATGSKPANEAEDIGKKQRWFRAYESNKAREITEARTALQYYHDKQWTDEETRRLKRRGQQPTVRNRIKRKIDFLVGVEQRLRRDPKAFPRTPKHEHDADVATAALRFATELNRWEKLSSDCMADGLVPGIGVAFVGIEGTDPKLRRVSYDRFFYDPRSVEPDFSDARYMGLHLWLDEDEAKARWPDKADIITRQIDASSIHSMAAKDTAKELAWTDFEHRRVRVVEFWELRPWVAGMFAWYFCNFTGETKLDGGWSPYKRFEEFADQQIEIPDNPYEAWTPYIDDKGDRYGMVRTLKSLQDEINYSASKVQHRIATDRFFYHHGVIEDPNELANQLARPDGKIEILGGQWGKDVGLVDQAGLKLQGEAERFQAAVTEIENYGPNPGLVGRGEGVDGASGRALLAQRDSGMTELSPIFERHRDWKLRVYRKLWNRIRQAWNGERWIRVTDDDSATQFIPLNQVQMDPQTGQMMPQNMVAELDVDILLNEGPDTITMNEELLQTLAGIGEAATGPLGEIIIELSNSPNKEKLIKRLQEAKQPPPEIQAMQQRMAKLEEMLQAATIDKTVAEVENKRADTLAKLVTASTPAQQQTDEFGNPMGPPPAAPDLGMAMNAMSMFPLMYGQPTVEQQAEGAGTMPPGPMGPDDMGGPGGPMPSGVPPEQLGMMGQAEPTPPGAAPNEMMMPEQIAPAGGLPVDPMA